MPSWDSSPLVSGDGSAVLVYSAEVQQELAGLRRLLAIGQGLTVLLLAALVIRK